MSMTIVTKTGDKGETSLYSGERVAKNHARIDLLGAVDELNANLGFLDEEFVMQIQADLFELGAIIANPSSTNNMEKELTILEEKIAKIEDQLPDLTRFILPRGTQKACFSHTSRAICRRAERLLVAVDKMQKLPESCLAYLNRLSDYLFQLARFYNLNNKVDEKFWKG